MILNITISKIIIPKIKIVSCLSPIYHVPMQYKSGKNWYIYLQRPLAIYSSNCESLWKLVKIKYNIKVNGAPFHYIRPPTPRRMVAIICHQIQTQLFDDFYHILKKPALLRYQRNLQNLVNTLLF